MNHQEIIACRACDMLHGGSPLKASRVARCTRCGTILYQGSATGLDRPLAIAVTGILLFMTANIADFLTLALEGREQGTLLISGVAALFREGYPFVAILAFVAGIAAPFLQLAGTTYVLLALRRGHPSTHIGAVFRWVRYLQPWAMAEVLLLGILVAVVKLGQLAGVHPGAGFIAFMALVFVLAALEATLDPESIWNRLPTT